MIPFLVFGEYDQVVSALVLFPVFIVQTFTGDVHFTTDNGLERLFRFCFFELGLQLRQLVLLVGVSRRLRRQFFARSPVWRFSVYRFSF